MRLWSLAPCYLDTKGLVALWREGLLARAVLRGATTGYRMHPQLVRFRNHAAPLSAINGYLHVVADEAQSRSFRFDRSKLGPVRDRSRLDLSVGQLSFEVAHLATKLRVRDPAALKRLTDATEVRAHPLFKIVPGPIADWERGAV